MSAHPVESWTKKAEDNYLSAQDLMRRRKNPVLDVVCNQCHQSAEKYLKALLLRLGVNFPKTHDLLQLEGLLAKIDTDARLIHEPLRNRNPYGVDIRYPGIETSMAEAKTAVKSAREVRRFVRAKLGLKS